MVDKTKIDVLTSTNETDEYRFGYTCEEIERLRYQHHVWAKENQRFISRAGFSKGATLVDLGCGPGYTTLDLAHIVGPGGRGTQSSRVKYTMSKIQNQILNKKWPYPSIVWFMVLHLTVTFGCAAVIGGDRKEPRILIIRNSSGAGIRSVTLGTADSSDGHHGKYGTVSPVPSGASQVYFRPDSAPPLPKTLLVSWVTNDSISHSREISPATATKSSHDPKANAMVFEIHPGDLVNIYWEVFPDGRSEGRGN